MKNLTNLLFLIFVQFTFAQTEWYASPTGLPIGDGSITNPWDLQTALNNTTDIQPGHTLWLRGGVYRGRFKSYLEGTATDRITVQSYVGEKAILDGKLLTPLPPIFNNPGVLKRVKRHLWSLDEENLIDLFHDSRTNGNSLFVGLDLEELDVAVLEVHAGYVDYKNFEITYSNATTRIHTDAGFELLGGLWTNTSPFCRYIELIIHNTTATGVATWKYSEGEEFHNCLVYNNGSQINSVCLTPGCPELNTGHGPGFYVQNTGNSKKILNGNAIFNNFKNSVQIYSASTTIGAIFDYVKNVDVLNCTIFNAGNPMPGTFSPYKSHKPEILVSTWWNGTGNPNIAKNIFIDNNVLYQNTDLNFASTSGYGTTMRIGERATAPTENINITNNKFFGRHEVVDLSYAKNTLNFKNNLVFGRTVFHNTNNPTNCDISNWDFSDNNYYNVESGRVFRDWVGINRTILQWQTDFTIDNNSFRYHQDSFQTTNSVKQFAFSLNKYLVTIINDTNNVNNNAINFTTVSGFAIPIGTPYRIIDVENYHAEANLPYSSTYMGTPVTFNMQSTAFEAPSGHVTVTPKTPTNFGCFIIEFDLCSNTTAALTLPTQTCTTAGALTNLAQYITDAPTTGVFSGVGVSQQGSEYVFDSATAGAGTHTITYTFQNNIGCPFTTITGSINVVANCIQKPYISQTYYNGTDKFIEVKNSSDTQNINAGNYYLVVYPNGADTSLPPLPVNTVNLNTIPAQGVKVWKAVTGTNLGYVTATDWAALDNYDGVDDIVVLTTSNGANAYNDRIDEFGKDSFNAFNDNITTQQQASFVRMSCAPAIPTPVYNQEHWVFFTSTEVANSTSKTNAELGRHYDESLLWSFTNTWNEFDILDPVFPLPAINESNPDRSRFIEIISDYCTGTNTTTCLTGYGSFEACGLELGTGVTLTINPSTNVKVFTSINATAAGSALIVENQGSLVMVYDEYNGVSGTDLINLGASATMQAEKQTIGINGPYDYVYWSSPLSAASTNPTINQIFPFGFSANQFNPTRFYSFENANFYDQLATYGNNGGGTDGYDDNFDDYNPFNTATEQASSFIPGRGYNTWPPIGDIDGYNVVFSGEMNNGEVKVPVYRNNSVNGGNYNLVGNPYPSPINLDILFAENINLIEPFAAIWGRAIDDTPNTGNTGNNLLNYSEDNYQIYNPTMSIEPVFGNNTPFNASLPITERGTLASCQSFFVRAKDPVGGYTTVDTGLIEPAGDLVFKNKMRTTLPNTTFARISSNSNSTQSATQDGDKLWINLTDTAGYTAQLGIAFLPTAQANFVQGEDIKVINGRKYNFYTQSTSEDLIIDVQNSFIEDKIIPLGITNTSDTSEMMFTISIAKKSGIFNSQIAYLYDAVLNLYHNLSNGSYLFTSNTGIIENRFSLRFTQNSTILAKQNYENEVVVFVKADTLTVKSKQQNIQSIEVFDIYTANTSGVLVSKKEKINALETQLPISSTYQLLNVKIQLQDGSIINKKIIK